MRSKSKYRLLLGLPRVSCLALAGLLAHAAPAHAEESLNGLDLEVHSGEVRDFTVRLGDGALPALRAELLAPSDLPEDLKLGFVAPGSPQPERWPGEDLSRSTVLEAGQPLHLRAMARRCSGGGSYRVPLRLTTASPLAGGPVELPIRVEVKPAGPCGSIYARTALAAASPVLVALVLFSGWSMFRRSQLLTPEALARKISPLPEDRGSEPNRIAAAEARDKILHGLPWQRRISAWSKTWVGRIAKRPWLALGGGEAYRERVRLELGRRYDDISVVSVAENELGTSDWGSLYAVASIGGGIRFVVMPGSDGRVGGMEMVPTPGGRGTELALSRRTELLFDGSGEDEPKGVAGWLIG